MKNSKNGDKNKNDKIPGYLFKKIKIIELKSKLLVNEAISGGYNSIFKGYGMEFQEVREYFPGDDYRTIDWNVTARNNSPYVKRFKEERLMNVLLLIDSSGSLGYGSKDSTKSQKLAETASLIAFTALSSQDKIGAIFFSDIIEKIIIPSKNKNTTLRLIREILFLKPKNRGTNINVALEHAIKTMKRRGIIFILSDFFDDNINLKNFFIARKKHDLIPVIFHDEFEDTPINTGLVEMLDNETGKIRLVDTSSKSYKKFIIKRNNKREQIFKELNRLRIDPIRVNTDEDIERTIVKYFQMRKKRIKA